MNDFEDVFPEGVFPKKECITFNLKCKTCGNQFRNIVAIQQGEVYRVGSVTCGQCYTRLADFVLDLH